MSTTRPSTRPASPTRSALRRPRAANTGSAPRRRPPTSRWLPRLRASTSSCATACRFLELNSLPGVTRESLLPRRRSRPADAPDSSTPRRARARRDRRGRARRPRNESAATRRRQRGRRPHGGARRRRDRRGGRLEMVGARGAATTSPARSAASAPTGRRLHAPRPVRQRARDPRGGARPDVSGRRRCDAQRADANAEALKRGGSSRPTAIGAVLMMRLAEIAAEHLPAVES